MATSTIFLISRPCSTKKGGPTWASMGIDGEPSLLSNPRAGPTMREKAPDGTTSSATTRSCRHRMPSREKNGIGVGVVHVDPESMISVRVARDSTLPIGEMLVEAEYSRFAQVRMYPPVKFWSSTMKSQHRPTVETFDGAHSVARGVGFVVRYTTHWLHHA